MVDAVLKLTALAVNLLGSPVEIHFAGGRRESLRLVREGWSGDMLHGSLTGQFQVAPGPSRGQTCCSGFILSRLDRGGNVVKGS